MKTNQSAQFKSRSFLSILLLSTIVALSACVTDQDLITTDRPIVTSQVDNSIDDGIFWHYEQMPYFPAGETALRSFVADSLHYPQEALINKIEGKAWVNCTIDVDGAVTNARIARSTGNVLLDAEALRVISILPNFIPGRFRGELCRVSYNFPVIFKLPE